MKKVKILFILLALLLIIIACFLKIQYENEQNKLKYKKEITISVGDKVPKIDDYVDKNDLYKVKNISIKWKKMTIDKDKIYYAGTYKGTFKFNKKEIPVVLNVIDKTAPTIDLVKDITIYKGNSINLLKDIKVNDNSHDKVEIKVEGTYNVNKIGEYKLKYIATDKSNNKTEKEFKLIVKEKEKNNTTNENKTLGTTTKGYKIEKKNGIYYINGILIANKTYGLPKNYNPGGLLSTFTNNFNKMKDAAKNANINLNIRSGFRSYNTQVSLYNNYVKRDGKTAADTYSARAGHSEHQTGLAADINSLEQSFINTKEGKWLNENCYKYGFIIRYPKGKEDITGYIYEPWHIRYVGTDIASKLYNNGNWITLEEYLGIDSKY